MKYPSQKARHKGLKMKQQPNVAVVGQVAAFYTALLYLQETNPALAEYIRKQELRWILKNNLDKYGSAVFIAKAGHSNFSIHLN